MKDESPERGILADSIAPRNRLIINTKMKRKRKTQMPKVPLIGNSRLLRNFEKIMIRGRSNQKCHVDDFTPNRKMGRKRKMIRG